MPTSIGVSRLYFEHPISECKEEERNDGPPHLVAANADTNMIQRNAVQVPMLNKAAELPYQLRLEDFQLAMQASLSTIPRPK